MGQPQQATKETFSSVRPINAQETFTNVTPIAASAQPEQTYAYPFRELKDFGSAIWGDVKGAFSQPPSGVSPYPGMDVEGKQNLENQSRQALEGEKQAGYGLPYRVAATFARSSPIPINVSGMEESAAQGSEAGVLGHAVAPLAVAATAKAGTNAIGAGLNLPKTATEFVRRATSLNEVTKAGAGVYQGKVQPLIQTLRGAIQNEGARTIQQAIEADKAATMQQGRGTISPSSAVASAAQAIEDTGHMPSAQTRALLSRLNNSSFLTLEDAKNLRSDFGGAASKADRAGNAKLGKVLWSAYDELGNGMKDRIKELQGTTEPFDHYNNEFRAYYELNKGIAGSMQDSIMDRHEAVPKLREFANADLSEIKDQAKKYGMDPAKFDEAQKNSKSVAAAHDSLSGKYNKSLYRMVMSGGSGAAIAVPLAVYAAAHGAGLYGLAPMLAASYVGAKLQGLEPQMETGAILHKLNVNPESFQVRTPVEGPKTFNYPNQDDVFSQPNTPSPSGGPTLEERGKQAFKEGQAMGEAKYGPLTRSSKAEAIQKVRAKTPIGKNEPAAEIPATGGVVENAFGEKTIHNSLQDWVESHGFEVKPGSNSKYEVGIPWSNSQTGASGIQWEPFNDMYEAREALGYGNEGPPPSKSSKAAAIKKAKGS